nr:glycoside hydrolase family 32 protein [uncultured Mediterraneibacter sp.]
MNRLERAREYEQTHKEEISEKDRPVYHVSPATGWMNDPNGFSFYQGKIHLFYQYYPYATKWGTMHWGHYVSDDFIRWAFMPAALAPDEEYESGCYSGSAIETEDGKHLIMYTAHLEKEAEAAPHMIRETQCIALGDGRDYVKYKGNPVLTSADLPEGSSKADFRDPKIWRENGKYYAVIASMAADQSGQLLLYSSDDGLSWQYEKVLEACRNEYGEMWECPDFFRLDGKAVVIVSPMHMREKKPEFHSGHNVIAIVGSCSERTFDFVRENIQNVDYGFDFYAAQTMEMPDGRRVMTAWMQSWAASNCQPLHAKWFCMMTIPRELSVRNGRIIQNPVRELKKYRKNKVVYKGYNLVGTEELDGICGRSADIEVTVRTEASECTEFKMLLAADDNICTEILCNLESEMITVDRSCSGLRHDIVRRRQFKFNKADDIVKFRVLLDRFSVELFVNDGEQAFSMCLYDTPQSAERIFFASDKPVKLDVEKYDICI